MTMNNIFRKIIRMNTIRDFYHAFHNNYFYMTSNFLKKGEKDYSVRYNFFINLSITWNTYFVD